MQPRSAENQRKELAALKIIENDANDIRNFENPDEDMQLLAVNNNPKSIQFIKKPFESVQKIAIENDPHLIKYFIAIASKEIREEALIADPNVIEYYTDSTTEEQRYVLMRFGDAILEKIPNRGLKTNLIDLEYNYKVLF